MSSRLRSVILPVATLALAVGTVGCGSSNDENSSSDTAPEGTAQEGDAPEDVAEYCGLVEEWAELTQALEDDDYLGSGARTNDLERLIELFTLVPQKSPDSIHQEMLTIKEIPPDAVRVSEAEEREEAVVVVDAYVEDECDLRFSFEQVDFTPREDF